MKLLAKFVALLLSVFSFGLSACEILRGDAFPSVVDGDGIITFESVPLEPSSVNNATNNEVGIDVLYFRCADGVRSVVGQLPFLAATGEVRSAFFADAGQGYGSRLFVIHSVGIRSDTGVKYSSDYYSVHVCQKADNGYIKDDRLSRYFGFGGDISEDDYNELLYVYPYKNQPSIALKLKADSYLKWSSNAPVTLTVNKKTSLYSSPVLAEVTRMYLIAGDNVTQENVEAGWISIVYKTSKGKSIRGWVQCADVDGC